MYVKCFACEGQIHLYFLVIFGVFGYVLRKLSFDVTPLVMAFILAPPLEYAFGQTMSLGNENVLIALVYNDGGGWMFGWGIDDVLVYEPLGLDAELSSLSVPQNSALTNKLWRNK